MPRDALFDLAISRALTYALRLGLAVGDTAALRGGLELWYLKTRFAYRIPLDEVVGALQTYPGGDCSWRGGHAGGWRCM
ncbi:hypothetical protein BH24DEI2_BH24DEI2_14340 [soil metagenome]